MTDTGKFTQLEEIDGEELKEIEEMHQIDLVPVALPPRRWYEIWRLNAEERLFWIEMSIILIVLFVAESSRGLVVPTLYLYVETVSLVWRRFVTCEGWRRKEDPGNGHCRLFGGKTVWIVFVWVAVQHSRWKIRSRRFFGDCGLWELLLFSGTTARCLVHRGFSSSRWLGFGYAHRRAAQLILDRSL